MRSGQALQALLATVLLVQLQDAISIFHLGN